MCADIQRRYSISEVSEETQVSQHSLRQWEARFPQLKPKRDRSNRRYYLSADIDIVKRIKQLVRHDNLTTKGASKRLSQELQGEGRPRTNEEIVALLDKIETQTRSLLDRIDQSKQGNTKTK